MTRDEIQKIRDTIHRHAPMDKGSEFIYALAILDAALAAPEQEPVVYWDGDRSVIPADEVSYIPNWTDYYPTPLYRPPAPQSVQPVAEVVAHMRGEHIGMVMIRSSEYLLLGTKLYTTPPSHEWQDLSPLEMRDTLRNCAASTFDKLAPNWYEVRQFARAIESALRAKNSGASHAEKDALQDAINSIYVYANDTLSGRTDGPDDRAWYRAGVVELRNRARALATIGGAVAARAALRKKNSGEQA